MPTSEPEIREMLRRRASAFSMPTEPPPAVARRVRRRVTGMLGLIAAGLASIGVAVTLLVGAATAPSVGDGGSSSSRTSVTLVSYLLPDTQAGGSAVSSDDELQAHIDCMRAQGFDIPDAVRTAAGLTIEVDPAVVDLDSPAWREAAFVTCRLPLPASGNFILGLSKERVDRFVACVNGEGFDLPEPTLNDDGEYVFDLTETSIDMSDPAWSRAAFVTCSPDVAP